ncbi:hypothetical protein KIN20_015578 [Parelaphostrongylus tenuis]|uniref:Uncharacterized protein n=1 Tax=Parelaphostrongylus tenuis TaxID=148309 RepID=A0AAD5QSK3_PARTN|nr:hypothetical protein KIN20_015578 [Parelaphostrongylus tenuis]
MDLYRIIPPSWKGELDTLRTRTSPHLTGRQHTEEKRARTPPTKNYGLPIVPPPIFSGSIWEWDNFGDFFGKQSTYETSQISINSITCAAPLGANPVNLSKSFKRQRTIIKRPSISSSTGMPIQTT